MSLDDELKKIRNRVSKVKNELKSAKIESTQYEEESEQSPFDMTDEGINIGSLSIGIEEIFKGIEKTLNSTMKMAVNMANASIKEISSGLDMELNRKIMDLIKEKLHGEAPVRIDLDFEEEDISKIQEQLSKFFSDSELKDISSEIAELLREVKSRANRDDLKDTVEDIKDEFEDAKEEIKDEFEDAKEEIKDKLEDAKEEIEAAQEDFNDIKDEVLNTLGEDILKLKENMRQGLEEHKDELMTKIKELKNLKKDPDED